MDIILVGGGSASGKSTFARALCDHIHGSTVIAQDRFYRCKTERILDEPAPLDFDIPRAIDFSALVDCLQRLQSGQTAALPVYDFATSTRLGVAEFASKARVIIVEGTMVLANALCRDLATLSVYIDADEGLRRRRREKRDVAERGLSLESVRTQLRDQVFPAHERYVAPSARYADLCLDASELEAEMSQSLDLVATIYAARSRREPIGLLGSA